MQTKPRSSLLLRAPAVLALLAALAPAAAAQERPPVLEQVRVGLPGRTSDPEYGFTRRGAWAPVYVKIKAGSAAISRDALRLVVETTDGEGAGYHYTSPVPAGDPESDIFAVTYVRPGPSDPLNLSLQTADGKPVPFLVRLPDGRTAPASRVTRDFRNQLENSHTLYLALGSRLPALSRVLAHLPVDAPDEDAPPEERSLRRLAFLDNARDLPDRWFGYQAADILVLATASDAFVKDLLEPGAAPRRKALGEWVRRGGKLVVSAGRNRQLVADLLDQMPLSEFDKQPLIDCKIEGISPRKSLPVLTRWATEGKESPPTLNGVELTVLRPNARPDEGPRAEPVNVLIREAAQPGGDKEGVPVVLHTACGLGRVILLGFDPETPPFSTWSGQKTFWEKLEAELEPLAPKGQGEQGGIGGRRINIPNNLGNFDQTMELGVDLKRGLESFQEVPVISFGWVALFILVYIIIVGPLDYLILKKVFKRLELTWITFPTVVLVISVAAYFTAYSLKGDDLRINKIDVVDIDLHGPAPQAYGATWVTLFSPRIQNYTIGVEPAAPKWADEPGKGGPASPPLVTVMDGSDNSMERMGSQSLFRRPYAYAADGSGLEGVAIPVWSMKTFSARWRAGVTPGKAPVDAELRHSRDKNDPALLGRVQNHLPVELCDVTLVYKGRAYPAPSVPPDGFIAVDPLKVGDQGKPAAQWLGAGALGQTGNVRTVTSPALLRDILFHSPPAQSGKGNSGLHPLDQSWRLRALTEMSGQQQSGFREEVMLIGRVASLAGKSETVTAADASPTRLWLGALPAAGAQRPGLSGYIVQDVYVRVYIPVIP
jgi:hypothetical protein